jgi:catechol 2,3-dioxygenase-like lactoylglutathione lyase family enzyme
MKLEWELIDKAKNFYTDCCGFKVVHVTEQRTKTGYVIWMGEFDNDLYFTAIYADGYIAVKTNERRTLADSMEKDNYIAYL